MTRDDPADKAFIRRRRRRRVGITVVAVLAVVATATIVWFATATRVYGTVACANGEPVSGVWVEGSRLGHMLRLETNSGFAKLRHQDQDGTTTFTWTRHLGGGQEFHVGCGRNGGQWTSANYSAVTTLTHVALNCDNRSSPDPNGDGVCSVTKL